MSTLAVTNPQEKALTPTPMRLIEMAMTQGLDADKLGQLMDLQMRWEANEARKAYIVAKQAFQKNAPEILRTKKVEYKEVKYRHAELDKICDVLIPELAKYGLSHGWKPEPTDNGKIRLSCVVTHEQGHSEIAATLDAPPDTTGSKNSVQAIGSTVYYLERYTLLAALGLAPKNQDDDGKTEGMADQAVEEFLSTIRDSFDVNELQRTFAAAYKAAKDMKDAQSMNAFIKAKDERKRELSA